eukprot:TRINITY_DN737_c0_g1_i1.p1 TRINITY_DN737_c0_g1~~TRINITY_DN737_c0_g1_i1.p1  ORF type:complete len:225 (-),score=30.70 TRINITY_DN737_c0_g1_i1:163-837(-)
MEASLVKVQAEDYMCHYCFDVLRHEFTRDTRKGGASKQKPPNPEDYGIPMQGVECPLFVGWHKQSKAGGHGHKLRGCKGTHGSLLLHEGLKQYALLSAFDDSRFPPVREEEIPYLICSISLLFAFEKASHCYDWEVGTHGVRIDFVDWDNVHRSATFLPHVAPQFGYDQKQTIERLVEKSGSDSPVDKRLASRIKTTRFQASLKDVPYSDYEAHIERRAATAKN